MNSHFTRRRFLQTAATSSAALAWLSARTGPDLVAAAPTGKIQVSDEVFHGHPDDNVLPTEEPIHTETLVHTGRISGEPRLFYNDTLLTTGNGIVNADFALTGLPAGVLFSVPFVSWFSPRHRQSLKFGWWNTSLRLNGSVQASHRVRSWYESAAIPVAQFTGGAMGRQVVVRACLFALPGEAKLIQLIRFENQGTSPVEAVVTMSGAARSGEEAGTFDDPVNGTVGRHRAPNPVECTTEVAGDALHVLNEAAGVFARLEGNGKLTDPKLETKTVDFWTRQANLARKTLVFELPYRIILEPNRAQEFIFSATFANERPPKVPAVTPVSLAATKDIWRRWLSSVEAIETPDKLFTAALRRSAAYSLSIGYEIAGRDEMIFHCDHLEWPVDCARDCYHIANSLLLIEPEIVRKHLRFYFLDAIPNSGAGKSYIGKGISCGEHNSRLLDLATYPLRELYRYWRATGDDRFVADTGIRKTLEKIIRDVSTWQSPKTGLFSSNERSSDERCVYPYFIPGNMMFVATLERIQELYDEVYRDADMGGKIRQLVKAGREGIYKHAVVTDREFGPMFAFEVGEAGEFLLYDQADIPNLISATRFGFCRQNDRIYQNTLKFIYSPRNQGYRGTLDGKFAALCDGSKTMPYSPWPLGAMSHLMSCCSSGAEARRLVEWLRECLTSCLQLPEICDKHTGAPIQRYWFGWPTAMMLMVYIETLCGVKIGKEITFKPLVPAGWDEYKSPVLKVRGEQFQVVVKNGQARKVKAGA